MKQLVTLREKQVEVLLNLNRDLEVDLSVATGQQDYEDLRIMLPERLENNRAEVLRFELINTTRKCKVPSFMAAALVHEVKWDNLLLDERYERAV